MVSFKIPHLWKVPLGISMQGGRNDLNVMGRVPSRAEEDCVQVQA